jgi:hypothetical protein
MPLTLKKPFTDEEIEKLANPVVLKDGTYSGEFRDAHETEGKKSGRLMIRATAAVFDDEGNEHEIPIYLHTANAALRLLLHTVRAVGAEAKFKAQSSISAEDIKGPARFVVGTEKKGRWPARSVILDVLPVDSADVVPLRAAGN